MRVLENDADLILVDNNINLDNSFLDTIDNAGMFDGYSNTNVSSLLNNGSEQDLRCGAFRLLV